MNVRPFRHVGVACAGLAFAAAPAIARPVPNVVKASYGAHSAIRRSEFSKVDTSQYLGGYDVGDAGSLTATSVVEVPKAKCANQKDYEQLYLGELLAPASGDAGQGGSTDAVAAVVMTCYGAGSTPFYYAEASDANGGLYYVSVQPGDLVENQISDSYGGSTTATTTDMNSGDTATSTGASTGDDTQLYLGAEPNVSYEQEGPVVDFAIPKFKTAKFTAASVNGAQWNVSQPTAYSLEQNEDVQIKTPAVPAKPTYNFTLTEMHIK